MHALDGEGDAGFLFSGWGPGAGEDDEVAPGDRATAPGTVVGGANAFAPLAAGSSEQPAAALWAVELSAPIPAQVVRPGLILRSCPRTHHIAAAIRILLSSISASARGPPR